MLIVWRSRSFKLGIGKVELLWPSDMGFLQLKLFQAAAMEGQWPCAFEMMGLALLR